MDESEKDGGMSAISPSNSTPWRISEELKNHYFEWGDRVELGAYPQSIRNREVTVCDEPNENGCYSGENGEYIKHDGAYFLIEPLQWQILSIEDDVALVICKTAVACMQFDPVTSNYANSEIRQWLNGEFLDTAFGAEAKKRIVRTIVDNSAEASGDIDGRTTCGNTYDLVFLPSVKELTDNDLLSQVPFWASDYAEDGAEFVFLRSSPQDADHVYGITNETAVREIRTITEKGYIVPAMRISLR